MLIEKLPIEDYFKRQEVGSSFLRKMLTHSPAHALAQEKSESTESQKLGTLIHTALLEPELIEAKYYITECENLALKEGKIAKAEAQDLGLELVKQSKLNEVNDLVKAVEAIDEWQVLKKGLLYIEPSLFFDANGVQCKTRPDFVSKLSLPSGEVIAVCDLKSCQNAQFHPFQKSIMSYLYHVQASMQIQAWKALHPNDKVIYFWVAVEPVAPFGTCIYQASDALLEEGRKLLFNALDTLKQCRENGVFPNYATAPKLMDVPEWKKKEE